MFESTNRTLGGYRIMLSRSHVGRAGLNIFDKSVIRASLLLAFAVLANLVLTVSDAKAYCTCGSGSVPCGVVCCSASTYCESGQICANGGCLSRDSARVCSNGNYCDQGDVCTPDGRCISVSSERYCGGRNFCQPGSACIGGGKCLSVTSERYCGNGKYCSEGSYCSGGGCRSHAADDAERSYRAAQDALRLLQEAQQEEQRQAEEKARAEREAAAQRDRNSSSGNSGNCSGISGLGLSSGTPCPNQNSGTNVIQSSPPLKPQSVGGTSAPRTQPPRTVSLSPPTCNTCDVLRSVGEILPDLAEKLDNLKTESIKDVEWNRFDGGPNTLRPFLPRGPLSPTSKAPNPLEEINTLKELSGDLKELSELTEKNKEPEDYAEICQNSYLDASWKAFTSHEGSYLEKAKAGREALKKCWDAAKKHIKDTVAGAFKPDAAEENN